MALQIKRIEGATLEEIQQRKFNPFFGLSVGNKAFTDELIQEYLKWSLRYCKKKVLVFIADSLYITNYLVLDGYSQSRAKQMTSKLGDEYLHRVQRIIPAFTKRDQEKIEIIRFDELKKSPDYIRLLDFFYQQYQSSLIFKSEILEITKDYLRRRNRFESKAEKLSPFVLDELPIFLSGVQYNGNYFTINLYPRFSKIDELSIAITNQKKFPEFAEILDIQQPVIHVEAYLE